MNHNDPPLPQPRIQLPHEAPVFRAFGDKMILHFGSDDTGGKFTMWTNITPPGGGPPPHYHLNEDEWFWPLNVPAEFLVDGQWRNVPQRTAVLMPRGTTHAFRNPNEEPLEMLIQTMPGGFDRFFAECAEEFAASEPPDMERIVEISARYGIHYPQPEIK